MFIFLLTQFFFPWQSNLNSSASNLPDSAGRPFTASFSGQSGSIPGFHHSGEHIYNTKNFG